MRAGVGVGTHLCVSVMCEHVMVKPLRGRAECGAEGEGRRDGWRKEGTGGDCLT